MAPSPNPSIAASKQLLLSHLDAGSTGCLHARQPGGVAFAVYIMLGEILAAHASDDRERLLLILQNTGAVDPVRLAALRRARAEGRTITEELFEIVPEELLQDLMAERFRENLYQFLQAPAPITFEAMESVFVENIQVGHESRAILDELERQVQVAARLRGPPGLVLAPGHGSMKDPRQHRLVALCSPRLPLPDLLVRAPFEAGRTLALVGEMLERGILVPVNTRESDTTDRPRTREAPPKVVVGPGRPDAGRERRQEKDAVAAALASAVSAAVAKVGRQREGASAASPARVGRHTAPTAHTDAPRARRELVDPGEPPAQGDPANAPTRPPTSGLDPVSAPIARKPAPAAISAHPPAPAAPASRTPLPPAAPLPAAAPAARDFYAFEDEHPTEEFDDEMAAFQDYDQARTGGEFSTALEHLDRVEIVEVAPVRPAKPSLPPAPTESLTIEMEDAENASRSELAAAVSLNFAGPKLTDEEAHRKLEVVSEVLVRLVAALDAGEGGGSGQPRAQLMIEGTPGAFASLFKGVELAANGALPIEQVLKNLRKRPASEHRRLLNRGLQDLIDRALSLGNESLDDAALEQLLESVAGYQQRLGM